MNLLDLFQAVGLHVVAVSLSVVFNPEHTGLQHDLLGILRYTFSNKTVWLTCLVLAVLTGILSFICLRPDEFLSQVLIGIFSSFLVTSMVTFLSMYERIRRRRIILSGYYSRLQAYNDYKNVLCKHNDSVQIVWYLLPYLMPYIYDCYESHSEYFLSEESKCLQEIYSEYRNILCNIVECISSDKGSKDVKIEENILGHMEYAYKYKVCMETYENLQRKIEDFSEDECNGSVWLSVYCHTISEKLERLCLLADVKCR